jgi:hypothetical protein
VLCVGLNSADTRSPGPGSTLKVPLGNGTAMLRPEAENMRADLATALPVASPVHFIYVVCRDPQAGGGHVALYAVGRRALKIK